MFPYVAARSPRSSTSSGGGAAVLPGCAPPRGRVQRFPEIADVLLHAANAVVDLRHIARAGLVVGIALGEPALDLQRLVITGQRLGRLSQVGLRGQAQHVADAFVCHGALVLQRIVAAGFGGQAVQIPLRAFDQQLARARGTGQGTIASCSSKSTELASPRTSWKRCSARSARGWPHAIATTW